MFEEFSNLALIEQMPKTIDSIEYLEYSAPCDKDKWTYRHSTSLKTKGNETNASTIVENEFGDGTERELHFHRTYPIETSLSELFEDSGFPFVNLEKSLTCENIKTIGDLVYLSMSDLVQLTGKHRTCLYNYQEALTRIGLDLGCTALDVALYRTNYLVQNDDTNNDGIISSIDDVKKSIEATQQAFIDFYYEELQMEYQIKKKMEDIRNIDNCFAENLKQISRMSF